jgi:hypothetical protein
MSAIPGSESIAFIVPPMKNGEVRRLVLPSE